MALPDPGLDIVLKQNRGRPDPLLQIHARGKKITDNQVVLAVADRTLDCAFHRLRSVFLNCIRQGTSQVGGQLDIERRAESRRTLERYGYQAIRVFRRLVERLPPVSGLTKTQIRNMVITLEAF